MQDRKQRPEAVNTIYSSELIQHRQKLKVHTHLLLLVPLDIRLMSADSRLVSTSYPAGTLLPAVMSVHSGTTHDPAYEMLHLTVIVSNFLT